MKIVDKTKFETKKFKDIGLENIFRWDGRFFMKVSNQCNYDGLINAYDFSKHRLTDFRGDIEVETIPAELVLHEKGWCDK